jgi:hypothetical protein
LVGFAVFNEYYVDYDNGDYQGQIATFVHEVMHALFFHPALFQVYPKNRRGQSYMFRDDNGTVKLRGNNILRFLREHSNCSRIDGGKF